MFHLPLGFIADKKLENKKRYIVNFKTVFFAVGGMILVNLFIFALILPLNINTNQMLQQAKQADNTDTVLHDTVPEVTSSESVETTAEKTLKILNENIPTLDGWTLQGVPTTSPLSYSVDLRCPVPASTVSPVYSMNSSYSYQGNPNTGMLIKLDAYSAGEGGKATEELIAKAEKCENIDLYNRNLGYAAESFGIDDNGAREVSGGEGRTVVFRVGDVVGSVSIRGADKALVEQIAAQWYSRWPEILTVDICPQQLSTSTDALRASFNPSSNSSEWLHRETVSLDDSRALAASISGRILLISSIPLLNGTPEQSKAIVPEEPLNTSPLLELVKYPDSLNVTLPADKPNKPGVPAFPKPPEVLTTEPIKIYDEVGPGCGWAFTGQVNPEKNETQEQENKILDARIAAADKLMEAKTLWWFQRYEYGQEYKTYSAFAEKYNTWIKEANKVISKAWWDAYTASLIGYQDRVVAYIEEYASWKTANPGCAAPENNIGLLSSPEPLQSLTPGCPSPPKPPVRPAEPTIPKPEFMP